MNVKSRAQLIVWCLPHLGFVETESSRENNTPTSNAATASIPAGSATVGGVTAGIQTIIPGRSNDLGGGNRGGNSDIGAMGM